MASIPTLMSLILGGSASITLLKYMSLKKEIERFKRFPDEKSNIPLTYISLFSGIGGFEVGIHSIFPKAKCVGFAEIDKDKIQMYKKNFPNHHNLGDIFNINKKLKADLLVGGFSCKSRSNLGAIARQGKKDVSLDTFHGTLSILKKSEITDFILENVPFRGKSALTNKEIVSNLERVTGKKVYSNIIDSCKFTGGNRKRIFFTSFPIIIPIEPEMLSKRFDFNLDPYDLNYYGFVEEKNKFSNDSKLPKGYSTPFEYKENLIKFMNNEGSDFNRWPFASDTSQECARTIVTKGGTYPSGIIIDRRGGDPLIRYMSVEEGVRLLGFPKGYLDGVTKTKAFKGLGDSVSPLVVSFLMRNLLLKIQ